MNNYFKTGIKIKTIFFVFSFILIGTFSNAQVSHRKVKKTELDSIEAKIIKNLSVDFTMVYSNYSRGILLNAERVAFQPSLEYDFAKRFTFGVWVNTNFSDNSTAYNEYDFTLSYQVLPYFNIMLGDYYYPATKQNNIDFGSSRAAFFDYGVYSAQTLEVCLEFDFSSKGIPIDFLWGTVIYGNDFTNIITDSEGNVISKERAFSSYSEIGYTYKIRKPKFSLRPFVGAAVINNGGYYGYYRNGNTGFSFINVGMNVTKVFKVFNNYKLPVFLEYIYNEDGNLNKDRTEIKHSFIAVGANFKILK